MIFGFDVYTVKEYDTVPTEFEENYSMFVYR